MFTCKRCNCEFTRKSVLISHLKKKKICNSESDLDRDILISELAEPILENGNYSCDFCSKKFNHLSNKCKHKHICKKNPNNLKNQKIQKLEEELSKLKKTKTITNNITNNNITNNNITNNIQINAFGKENIDYLIQNTNFQNWFLKCLKTRKNGLCEYMCKKHFYDKHPENTNIRKLVKNDAFIETFDGKEWKPRFKQEVLDDIFEYIRQDYTKFISEALDQDGLVRKQWLDNFMIEVGESLIYDFSCNKYDYDYTLSDAEKNKIKKNIYNFACQYIYNHSKQKI